MRRSLPALLLAYSLLACATEEPLPPQGRVTLVTQPDDATVSFPDGTTCQTPCQVVLDAEQEVTIGKAGYAAVRERLPVTASGEMVFELDLLGATEPVETIDLDAEPGDPAS